MKPCSLKNISGRIHLAFKSKRQFLFLAAKFINSNVRWHVHYFLLFLAIINKACHHQLLAKILSDGSLCNLYIMRDQLVTECLFEMRLNDIYNRHSWLRHEISAADFVKLFPVRYKNQKPVKPESPPGFSLTRPVFLEVLVAFGQCFK